MKRILFILLLTTAFVSVSAQEKSSVVVEDFTSDRGYSDSDVRTIRENVIRALLKTGRINVLDKNSDRSGNDQCSFARGYLQQPATSQQSGVDRGEKFTITEAKLNYIVTIISPFTGGDGISFMFTTKGSSLSGKADAISDACKMATLNMSKMMEMVFPLKGKVVMVDEEKNSKALTVYINLGANNGIKEGQKFDATIMKDVAGDKISKTIGTLTAKELSEYKCLCKVNEGGEEILSYVNSGEDVFVNTREKKGFFKAIGETVTDVYGGGFIKDTGVRVDTPQANKTSTSITVAEAPRSAQEPASVDIQIGDYRYYDFVKGEDGIKYIEPTLNWSSKKADIIEYMKNAGYSQEDNSMLTFKRNDDDDPHSQTIMYMILNGQYYTATSMLREVKKDDVLSWMKSQYTYKGAENDDMMDMHKFKSKDKKTNIMVSFMNLNESEFSTVTIMYQKE